MSKILTRKEIKDQRDSLTAEIQSAKTESAEQVASLKAEIESAKAESAEQVASLQAEIESGKAELVTAESANADLMAKVEAFTAEKATLEASIAELTEKNTETNASLEASALEIEKLTLAVQSPANIDAAMIPAVANAKIIDLEADDQEVKLKMQSEKFKDLSPLEQNKFIREGGKIDD